MLLKNTKTNEADDVIFNQQSNLSTAPTFDIDFVYSAATLPVKSDFSTQPATAITFIQLSELQPSQKIAVTATVSKGMEQPKAVHVKATQKMATEKEDNSHPSY